MSVSIDTLHSRLEPEGPVYVTYWTQHGTYPEHGQAWLENMDRLGVAYQAASFVTEGLTWCGRCRLKPAWLIECLDENLGRRIVWLDVDSVMNEVPPEPDADIGIVEVPRKFAKIGMYAAGVLHLANNRNVWQMLTRWKHLAETEPEDYSCDMNLLERAIHGDPDLTVELLDVGHCHVPGVFEEPEKVYVYGKQASRVERNR